MCSKSLGHGLAPTIDRKITRRSYGWQCPGEPGKHYPRRLRFNEEIDNPLESPFGKSRMVCAPTCTPLKSIADNDCATYIIVYHLYFISTGTN